MQFKSYNIFVLIFGLFMVSKVSAVTCEDINSALSAAFNTNKLQSFAFKGMWSDNRTCEFILSSPCNPAQEALQKDTVFQTFNNHPNFNDVRLYQGDYQFLGAGCSATVLFKLPVKFSPKF